MYTTTSRDEFIDTFIARGRADTGDGKGGNFTIDGLNALFDYLEDFEESMGESIQFDPIGLCCQFAEYQSAAEAVQDINPDMYSDIVEANAYEDEQDLNAQSMDIEGDCLEWINGQTTTICFNNGIIIDSEF